MDCIFCKIRDGEIPSYKVYEDEHVFAFLDITQGTTGHTLVVPRKHVRNIYDIDEDTISHVFRVIPKLANALKEAFDPIGINIVNNNDEPLQSVFHFHVHLIPRYHNDGMVLSTLNNYGKITDREFQDTVAAIKDALSTQ
jgi:histidine triad (HIT) family protein